MPNWTKPDTLAKAFESRLGLMDLLGKDLYNVLESGKIKAKLPFGTESSFNFRNEALSLRKKVGRDWQFDLDINKRSPSGFKEKFRLGVTKKF
tara:strand:- start:156 stop:434 length:279 start_codon:yes stop_codon:yes gene_type:complete